MVGCWSRFLRTGRVGGWGRPWVTALVFSIKKVLFMEDYWKVHPFQWVKNRYSVLHSLIKSAIGKMWSGHLAWPPADCFHELCFVILLAFTERHDKSPIETVAVLSVVEDIILVVHLVRSFILCEKFILGENLRTQFTSSEELAYILPLKQRKLGNSSSSFCVGAQETQFSVNWGLAIAAA